MVISIVKKKGNGRASLEGLLVRVEPIAGVLSNLYVVLEKCDKNIFEGMISLFTFA